MNFKDIIGLSLVSLFLFPIVLFGVLFATGFARIEFGKKDGLKEKVQSYLQQPSAEQVEWERKQSKIFIANQDKQKQLEIKEEEIAKELERMENLRIETQKLRDELLATRKKMEAIVASSSELQDKKIKALAEVYGSMRPEEAAPILLSLEDPFIVKILQKIPEARNASKILAAVAALQVHRAAKITKLLGSSPLEKNSKAKMAQEAK